MPDSVIGRSKIHKDETRLTSSFIALFNIASQFDNLLGSRAVPSKATLSGRQMGVDNRLESKQEVFKQLVRNTEKGNWSVAPGIVHWLVRFWDSCDSCLSPDLRDGDTIEATGIELTQPRQATATEVFKELWWDVIRSLSFLALEQFDGMGQYLRCER